MSTLPAVLAPIKCDICLGQAKRCGHCRKKRVAQFALAVMANYQLAGVALEPKWVKAVVQELAGCVSSVDKMYIDKRDGEIGVYLLTLVFDNLTPKV